nr:hypothetical protein [Salipiger sp. CCB-MM3]
MGSATVADTGLRARFSANRRGQQKLVLSIHTSVLSNLVGDFQRRLRRQLCPREQSISSASVMVTDLPGDGEILIAAQGDDACYAGGLA